MIHKKEQVAIKIKSHEKPEFSKENRQQQLIIMPHEDTQET